MPFPGNATPAGLSEDLLVFAYDGGSSVIVDYLALTCA